MPTDSSLPKPTIRVTVIMSPKKGMTHVEFSRYWKHRHSQLFKSLDIVKRNLTRYEQVHPYVDPQWTALLPESFSRAISPIQGMTIFEADSLKKIAEVFTDKEYLRVVVPDEEKFMDHKSTQIMVSEVYPFIAAKL